MTEKNTISNFKDLIAWQEGHKLVLIIYKSTKEFPKEEIYSLVSQMRRCAVSVSSNIAEGFGRRSYKEKIQFYYLSRESIIELENQLLISYDLGYLSKEIYQEIQEQIDKVHKLINSLIKRSKEYQTQSTF